MLYYMNSKEFFYEYLQNEREKDILDAQYILCSTRIYTKNNREFRNILVAKNILFPTAMVASALTSEDFKERYLEQCESNKIFLAYIIRESINAKLNMIFICTKNESKLKFLKYLAEFIYLEFGYPMYNYSLYSSGSCELIKYNKEKILKRCERIIREAKNSSLENEIKKNGGVHNIIKQFKELPKKEIKKVLKEHGMYRKGSTKSEMLEDLELIV